MKAGPGQKWAYRELGFVQRRTVGGLGHRGGIIKFVCCSEPASKGGQEQVASGLSGSLLEMQTPRPHPGTEESKPAFKLEPRNFSAR